MNKGIIFGIFLIIFISGCATADKTRSKNISQFQARINDLESELRRKDAEISRLEDDLEQIQARRITTAKLREEEKDVIKKLSAKEIQKALKNAGFYDGPIDGRIGPKTKEAIKAFQRASGLNADGIIGNRTASKLVKYLTGGDIK